MFGVVRQRGILSNVSNLCRSYCNKMSVKVEETIADRNSETFCNKSDNEKRLLEDDGDGTSVLKKQCIEKDENTVQNAETAPSDVPTPAVPRVKKRNTVLMMGYLGKNYYGMQRNQGMKTIEEDFLSALFKAGYIDQNGYDVIQNNNFQRAARTDKGVSALRQIVSMKLPDAPEMGLINSHLPEEIRVFGIKRVTKGFNSKNQCDARTYEYTLPTYSFAMEGPLTIINRHGDDNLEERVKELSVIDGKPYHEFRITDEIMTRVNSILQQLEGTHNFHNFTCKVKPLDPSAKRFIMKMSCRKPFIAHGMEFLTIEIKGQSFMLHQIRKMVALAVAIIRKNAPEDSIERAFSLDKIDVPTAPSLGLVLNYVHYDRYNKRYGSDGCHETLEWNECDKEVNEFYEKYIQSHIVNTEIEEKSMLNFLASLAFHSFLERE